MLIVGSFVGFGYEADPADPAGPEDRLQEGVHEVVQADDHPDAVAFRSEVNRLGWQTGLLHKFVSRCLPQWQNKLAGHAELTVFLDGMNTPKFITAGAIAEFDKGVKTASDMTCGDDKSSQIGAVVLSETARETIHRLKALSFVPSVFYHQGNPL